MWKFGVNYYLLNLEKDTNLVFINKSMQTTLLNKKYQIVDSKFSTCFVNISSQRRSIWISEQGHRHLNQSNRRRQGNQKPC